MTKTTCPVKLFAVCLLGTFPSNYSICNVFFFLFSYFCDAFTYWAYCESAIIFCGPQTPSIPLNHTLPVHELWCIYQNSICFFEDCGQGGCWKSTTLFLFLMHLYSSTSDAEPGRAYRWRGAPVPCVCWYMYLQTSSQPNIVLIEHTLPMSVWCDFHGHHLLRNRCMKPSVVAMQKTATLCWDLYQMHHIWTCGLATGDTSIPLCVCHASENSSNLPPILNWLPLT